ncbi:MAG: hypothetical protein M3Y70_01250 [Pseudomonadota bacterium]|nr:hypothetical protein [Pseudomonadota bacterium]
MEQNGKSAFTGDIAMKISGIRLLGMALCLAVSGVALAQDASPIQITNTVFQEVEAKAADGTTSMKLVPAAKVVPGGEVVYHIDVVNNGDAAATDVVINNAVPSGLVLSGDPRPAPSEVSVDGGETFGNLADLAVTGVDGAQRAAQLTDVTHLRWVIATLAPRAETQVIFRARVK